jgi:hypothetical protein
MAAQRGLNPVLAFVLRDGKRVYDFQRFPLPALNESLLRENKGPGQSTRLRGYTTSFWLTHDTAQPVPGSGAIDWDQNGRIDSRPRHRDLNDDGEIAALATTPNEWSILVFDGRTIGKKENVATLLNVARSQYRRMPVSELSEDMQRKIHESQPQP